MSFEATLYAAGLMPKSVIPDGKWRRCATTDKPKKRNGAYVLHPDGRGYWRNWALDTEINAWGESDHRAKQIDPAVIAQRREAEKLKRRDAIKAARAFWSASEPMRALHPYLEAKRLAALGCGGLRVNGESLIVPVYWGERLTSLQSIRADGQKRFWPGAPVKAGAFVMHRARSAVTAVCEGLATGLAIYQAVPHASVIVAFDAGNLVPVVERMKPSGSVVICADNDHGTEQRRGTNPGIEKAKSAAELIGAGVAWPEGIEGTDWADALLEWGAGAAKRIERQILARAQYVT